MKILRKQLRLQVSIFSTNNIQLYGIKYSYIIQMLFFLVDLTYTGWNDKIVVLKKTTLQFYFKTFIEKNQFR